MCYQILNIYIATLCNHNNNEVRKHRLVYSTVGQFIYFKGNFAQLGTKNRMPYIKFMC